MKYMFYIFKGFLFLEKISKIHLCIIMGKNKAHRLHDKVTFLKTLKSLPKEKRNLLIPYLSDDGCATIYECVTNILHNKNIKNRKKLKSKLSDYKNDLRYLGNSNISNSSKKRRLNSKGGAILPLILTTAIPLLMDAIKAIVKR